MDTLYSYDKQAIIERLGKEGLLKALLQMLLIRHFEVRAESAYQHGHIGGFFHAYIGQEAIQTAAVNAIGLKHWWTTTYRCHALALLMEEDPNALMAELFGKETGNALGRGGSMHLYSDNMLGGFGIVGGHVPVATGAAFASKYLSQDKLSICFLGDGAVAQGAVHESLNLAALWELPALYVIENNQWGMGTHASRAIAVSPIAPSLAKAYGIKSAVVDGMDYCSTFAAFSDLGALVAKTSRPVLVEVMTERFRGHSISDPALYRSKEDLAICKEKDPITHLKNDLIEQKWLDQDEYERLSKQVKERVLEAIAYAEKSPWPSTATLEEGVFAP